MFPSSLPRNSLVIAVVALTANAYADQVCHTIAVPLTATTFDVAIAIPRFDTAFGTLQSVAVTFTVQASATSQIESVGGSPYVGNLIPGVSALVSASDNTVLASGNTTASSSPVE